MAKTTIARVYDLRDPYFGRAISHKGEEIAKVFAYYAKKDYEDHQGWTKFSYRHWSGYEEEVKVRISRVLLTEDHSCYIEMETTSDILDHYWPSPYDLINKRYIGTSSGSINPNNFTKVALDYLNSK